VAHEHAVAAMLIETGRLSTDQALRRSEIERALAEMVQALCVRWLD
jgi:hypothetical protein